MMRATFCLSRILIVIAVLCFTVSAVQSSEIKLALDSPPDLEKSGTYVWARVFADHLTAQKLFVKEYAVNALGNEAERLDQVSQGLLEVSMSDLSRAGQLEPAIMGFTLPFLWDNMEHLDRALSTSDLLMRFNEKLSKKGIRVLSLVALGNAVGIANTKKPIRSVDDMKGMRMRAMDKFQTKYYEQWGCNSVVVPWPEIYNALQTGIADGYVNPSWVPVMFKHTELIKYYTNAAMNPSLRIALASEEWYSTLSKKDKELVDAAVSAANSANRKWVADSEEKALAALKAAGVEVIPVVPAERARFTELSRKAYPDIIPAEYVPKFMDAAEKARKK
ncbi:MAG: TRAP transporter substrate-binding protein [Deltaproteobacteria bacterium]|nr:TRAP transporter substrate-binding protein [Deltaproteobacteria bacterium]